MKWRSGVLLEVAFALCVSVVPLHAQTSAVSTKPVAQPWYDTTKEVTLTGTVTSVVKAPARGTEVMVGSHLVMQTNTGSVDTSLGKYALRGKGALSVTTGDRVQVTGIMKTVQDKQVFVARVIITNGHAYAIRNEHGIAYLPAARKGTANSEAKGGTL
jgi:DNA/RNA endonuclease YhcR with UshA esterase domain